MTAGGPGGPPVPAWLRTLAADASRMDLPAPLRPPAAGGGIPSAVLVLFAEGEGGPGDPELLFIQRSNGLRLHAGQPAFPGGAVDAADSGPVAAALREAAEEVGVDPAAATTRARGRPGSRSRPSIPARWPRWSGSASANWPIPPSG